MTPDRLILSDRLITMAGPETDGMQGVAIRGDRIERLVTRAEVESLRGPTPR